jgi:flagellar biosynthesis protein FlhB
MAEGDDSEEKSQEPTEKRKDDARKDGQVLTSKEAFVFASMAAGTGLLALSAAFGPQVLERWTTYFKMGSRASLDDLLISRLSEFWVEFLVGGLAFATPLALVAIGLQMAMGGINFAPKAASFNFGKLNPLTGLGRMASVQSLVELGKGVLKVVALGGLAIFALKGEIVGFDRLSGVDTAIGLSILWGAILTTLAWLCLGLAGIGALDFAWAMVSMRKKLMMSFQEVKQESKESNGSPELKGRIRRMQMEASQRGAEQRAALGNVVNATAIVTNPIHFAVALRYVPGETAAPMILAMGKGPMAQEIIARGKGAGVHVLQSPPLARALYFTGNIGGEISDRLFGAVAAILAHVYRLDRGEYSDLPDVTLPRELLFTEHGRPINEAQNGA